MRNIVRNICLSVLGLAILVTVYSMLATESSSAKRDATRDLLYAKVRDGVGKEVRFPTRNSSEADIVEAVEVMAGFIKNRAGLELSAEVKNRLAAQESAVLRGEANKIKVEKLADIITELALKRASTLSDEELAESANILMGIDSPELPEDFKRGRQFIRARGSISTDITPEEFIVQVKALRNADARVLARRVMWDAVNHEVEGRVRLLSEAMPEVFGKTGGSGTAAKRLTPLQAFLVVYSVVSDDLLADGSSRLEEQMWKVYNALSQQFGTYINPTGFTPYGSKGYFYSTPLDIVFNNEIQLELINNLTEGRN